MTMTITLEANKSYDLDVDPNVRRFCCYGCHSHRYHHSDSIPTFKQSLIKMNLIITDSSQPYSHRCRRLWIHQPGPSQSARPHLSITPFLFFLLLFLLSIISPTFQESQVNNGSGNVSKLTPFIFATTTTTTTTTTTLATPSIITTTTPKSTTSTPNSYQFFVPPNSNALSNSLPNSMSFISNQTETNLTRSLASPNVDVEDLTYNHSIQSTPSTTFLVSKTSTTVAENLVKPSSLKEEVGNLETYDYNQDNNDQDVRLMPNLSLNFYRTKRRSNNNNGGNGGGNQNRNRKRKRELFAYTSIIANSALDDPSLIHDEDSSQTSLSLLHKSSRMSRMAQKSAASPNVARYWSGHSSVSPSGVGGSGGGSRRMRRLSQQQQQHLHSTNSAQPKPSSLSIYAKVNLKPSSSSSSLSSFSSSSSSSQAASSSMLSSSFSGMIAAHNSPNSINNNPPNSQNIRMKIMLNPPGGFGPGMAVVSPDQKCNFEIYPSGCFDENGSICDSSGSGHCVCRPGYSIRIGGIYCVRPAAIGEACYTTEQCERKVANSGCFNYREEYREENPSAFFGPSQSQWPMGECRCRVGHRYSAEHNSCIRSLIGSWCSNVWDCELVELDSDDSPGGGGNHSSNSGHRSSHGSSHSSSSLSVRSNKRANLVCENNLCNCSQHFHYNQSTEQCQFRETFGQRCYPMASAAAATTQAKLKRNIHKVHSGRSVGQLVTAGLTEEGEETAIPIPLPMSMIMLMDENEESFARTSPDGATLIACNMPTVCNENGTCSCADGYEHQPKMSPQCQLINKATAGSHYFHSGSSIRTGTKAAGDPHGSEGQSNIGNFVEYVLYVLVPALIIIFMFKPCFRRIGEWRNHIHHYQSDSDFFLAGGPGAGLRGPAGLVSEMNVIGSSATGVEKNGGGIVGGGGVIGPGIVPPGTYPGDYVSPYAFAPHLACHNAYIFEPADPCGYGANPYQPALSSVPGIGNPAAMALLREKLQTIEECQSEDIANPAASAATTCNQLGSIDPNGIQCTTRVCGTPFVSEFYADPMALCPGGPEQNPNDNLNSIPIESNNNQMIDPDGNGTLNQTNVTNDDQTNGVSETEHAQTDIGAEPSADTISDLDLA